MELKVNFNSVYKPAGDNVVARDIQGEFILVPIISGIGDMEDEIFSLNETGKAVWQKMDGRKSLKDIAKDAPKLSLSPKLQSVPYTKASFSLTMGIILF